MNVVEATDKDFYRFYGFRMPNPWEGFAAKEGDLIVGMAGAYVMDEGHVMAFMDLTPKSRTPMVFRYVITYFKKLKARNVGLVFASCDDTIPRADEFLARLGFTPTDVVEDNKRYWTWQH